MGLTRPRTSAVAVSSTEVTYPCEQASIEVSSAAQALPILNSLVTDLVLIHASIPRINYSAVFR